jgi:hypothetical protein
MRYAYQRYWIRSVVIDLMVAWRKCIHSRDRSVLKHRCRNVSRRRGPVDDDRAFFYRGFKDWEVDFADRQLMKGGGFLCADLRIGDGISQMWWSMIVEEFLVKINSMHDFGNGNLMMDKRFY